MSNIMDKNEVVNYEQQAEEKIQFEREYKRRLSDTFFSKAIPVMNKMVGVNTNAQFSLGLFLKLPINFMCTEVKEEEFNDVEIDFKSEYSNQPEIAKFIISNLKAYVINLENVNKIQVNMNFSYKDKESLDKIVKAMDTNIGILFLTFIYFHEIQHILRRHNTTTFNDIMLRTAKTVDPEKYDEYGKVHQFANFAEDYIINNALLSMFKTTNEYNQELEVISKNGLFDSKYEKDNETSCLIKLLNAQPKVTKISEDEHSVTLEIQERNEDGTDKGEPKVVTIPKESQPEKGDGEESKEERNQRIERESKLDQSMDALADSIQNHIDEQKEKGDGSFVFNKDIGESIKTNVDWFDKLKSNFFTIVNRKTKQTLVNWSKLNSKYSHSHKSPTHRNLQNQLNVILSVDNSGSMSDEALKKLLYIIEQKKSKIGTLTILKHTDNITNILVDETDERKILQFLGTRDNGGTSHRDVFKYLDENITKHTIDQSIFISFSDNYSDIESEYRNYKNIQKITKVWLNAQGKAVEHFIPGLKVDIF